MSHRGQYDIDGEGTGQLNNTKTAALWAVVKAFVLQYSHCTEMRAPNSSRHCSCADKLRMAHQQNPQRHDKVKVLDRGAWH